MRFRQSIMSPFLYPTGDPFPRIYLKKPINFQAIAILQGTLNDRCCRTFKIQGIQIILLEKWGQRGWDKC